MKKIFSFFLLTVLSASLWADKLYLNTETVNYPTDGALVAVWSWGGTEADAWSVFSATSTANVYQTDIASGRTGCKIVRFQSSVSTPDWDAAKWNESGDITIPTDGRNMVTLTSWDGDTGTWSTYSEGEQGGSQGGGEQGGQGGTASYGIMINGTDYHAGTLNPKPLDPSFTEYQVLGVSMTAGQTCQLWDQGNNVGWAVDLDAASVSAFTRTGDYYTCSADGTYDFYIKLKQNADQLYIGGTTSGGGEQGGGEQGGQGGQGGGGGSTGEQLYYYLKESGMGSPSADELFENGILENYNLKATDASGKAYIFLIVSNTEGSPIGKQYMTMAYIDGGTSAQVYPDGVNKYEKWGLMPGTYTFYLYKDAGDSYTISTQLIPGRTLVDAGSTPLNEVEATLDLTAPMFNTLGQQVDADYKGIVIQNGKKYIK